MKYAGTPLHLSVGDKVPAVGIRKEYGFCILRILDIFSACEVWFTFVYRKQEHLAVGSSGNGLTYSRGVPLFAVALPSPFVPLLYHTLRGLSRGFFRFSEILFSSLSVGGDSHSPSALPEDYRTPLVRGLTSP